VFGFATGVFIGHMILNAFLFLNPKVTIQIVKNSIISLIGSVVFVALGLWGFHEAYKLLFH
jgi:putative Ca2+/H+ antiporter (TMEM165/GDT1 family)